MQNWQENTIITKYLQKWALANGEAITDEESVSVDSSTYSDLVELEDLRTESAKVYQNSDDSKMAKAYAQPIHYKDETGRYKDIDNRLEENNDPTENIYKNKANKFKTFLAKNTSSANLVKLKQDKYSVSFTPLNVNKVTGEVNGDSINYPKVYENIDLKYTITSSGAKEDIIINSYTGQNVFSFEMVINILEARLEENNSIVLYDATTNEEVWLLTAPFALDANDVFSGDVFYELEEKSKGKYLLKVVVSKEYLESPDTQYPVIVDPSVNTLGGTTYDSYIMSAYPEYNYYTSTDLRAGYTSSTEITRSYLKFTLPALSGGIVSSACLKLYEFTGEISSTNKPHLEINYATATTSVANAYSHGVNDYRWLSFQKNQKVRLSWIFFLFYIPCFYRLFGRDIPLDWPFEFRQSCFFYVIFLKRFLIFSR